ncbi:hypothetical protein GCK72_006020 [Caenorhabditis remanei]|uniref:Uncharacterized protein n=1 Tax=Caenorhabditis remanei TaxID=31234 RepID=E3M4L4_CAERE|nr:hypothetical protein GCK72_006020 [Caenorhabditis remanei]EFO91503.1 hypothetical protein CRE_11944 [Caenorhabditis remanei]KAF1766064.1 hypothetical protein GCK72_006020 [Caenorhabditis remanei]
MSQEDFHSKTEIERLRDENAVLRSILMTKFTCPDCSTNGNVYEELSRIRAELFRLNQKQQEDTDRNRKLIEKIRSVLVKRTEEKRAITANKTSNLENVIEQHRNELFSPLPPSPKIKSIEERFSGEWKLTSSEDSLRYIKFRNLSRKDFLDNKVFIWNGTNIVLPPEPEVDADPNLVAFTHLENGNLKTVLKRKNNDRAEVTIGRFLENNDNSMTIIASFNLFYNLTNSRQTISCTRIYERIHKIL